MARVVGVRFKDAGKIYYFSYGDLNLEKGDRVIVETARGLEFGEIVTGPKEVPEKELEAPLKDVLRRASEEDIKTAEENREKEKEAFKVCSEKIKKHNLPMKLVNVEFTFDVSKIIFYFTADSRVDFRLLVKDLAAMFRTRIELRQIGVRDEAKMLGGIGCCGRVLCCATFLGDFDPVSIRMAKDQNLSLNPGKISGVCGRLMCCLRFENYTYECAKDCFPSVGDKVATPEGEGIVKDIDVIKENVQVMVNDERLAKFSVEDVVEKDEDIDEDARKKENEDADNGSSDKAGGKGARNIE